jgi:DNA (cytosine-5)-methyltransferase 1
MADNSPRGSPPRSNPVSESARLGSRVSFFGCRHMAEITFGSLFAGIGGFDLGFERAGMSCKWQVEIDDYANKVLANHWPDVHRERDIRECGKHNLELVDVICGGFPCQDISLAGDGAGINGTRSGLWHEYARIICELEPRVVVVENVAALLIRGFDRVLGTLANLGYDAEWSCVSACSMGAPHSRDRMFIVAHRREVRWNRGGWDINGKDGVCSRLNNWEAAKGGTKWGDVERWIKSIVEDGGGIIPPSERSGMANGIPNRLDRVGGCGNAVVPQVAEFIGRKLLLCMGENT